MKLSNIILIYLIKLTNLVLKQSSNYEEIVVFFNGHAFDIKHVSPEI
jgi:hypothetical protein